MLKFILVVSFLCATIRAEEWTYPGPWGQDYPECNGENQSPIDFKNFISAPAGSYPPLEFSAGYIDTLVGHLVNDGHTVKFDIDDGNAFIEGGAIKSGLQLELVQINFHWGNSTHPGSEHTVDGFRYPGEMHLVHKNSKYATLDDAFKNADGVAILAFFLTQSFTKQPFKNIDNELVNLNGEVGQIDGVKENMKKILRSANLDSYYVYLGSLTTPPCNERVTWFVFTTPINMSYQFSQTLMSQRSGSNANTFITNNYRPIQSENHRFIILVT